METKIYDNRILFSVYGIVNIALIILLLTLLTLIFNEVYILSRFGFVIFVGIHLMLFFFVKIHYLSIFFDKNGKQIEFHYNRKFGLKWREKSRTTLLPIHQFDGYRISKDSLGLSVISFFKKENTERYELGPFHVGYISKKEIQRLKDSFGVPLNDSV